MTTDEHVAATVDAASRAIVYAAKLTIAANRRAQRYRLWALFWFSFAMAELFWQLFGVPPWGYP